MAALLRSQISFREANEIRIKRRPNLRSQELGQVLKTLRKTQRFRNPDSTHRTSATQLGMPSDTNMQVMSAPGTKRVRPSVSPERMPATLQDSLLDTTEASVMALRKAKQRRLTTSTKQVL